MKPSITPESPVKLPTYWALEYDSVGNVLLRAGDAAGSALGWATIDEKQRVFALGMCRPHGRASEPHPEYQGRGWRARLYGAAVEALGEAVLPIRKA